MADNLVPEIDGLQKEFVDLTAFEGDSEQLVENLLSICSGLLALYSEPQASGNGDTEIKQPSISPGAPALSEAIISLKQIQQALREVELHYKSVLENDNVLICRMQPDGRIKFANRSLVNRLHLSPDNYTQINFFHILGENQKERWQRKIAALNTDHAQFSITHAVQPAGGIYSWHQWNCRGYFDPDGKLIDIQAVGHDVTAIKLAEITAEKHNRELTALHTATQALLTTLDSEVLLGQILDAAVGAVPVAQKGTLHLIARDTGQLELRASIGYVDPRIQKFSYSESSGYVARAVRERKPMIFHDTIGEIPNPRREFIPEVSSIRSAIVAPLILKDRVLGAISLESSSLSAFSESDLRLLVSIAVTATNAIYNAELHAEVQKLAITDSLTGLYNRRGFIELGEREIERSFRFKRPLTVILLDVDRLKDINDTYGHFTGDHVLRNIAIRCGKQLRKVDILGRYGGDEFVVLLPETHMRMGSIVAERIRNYVSGTQIPAESDLIQASVSLGIAGLTTEITNLDDLINRADLALYSAKQSGRNQSILM